MSSLLDGVSMRASEWPAGSLSTRYTGRRESTPRSHGDPELLGVGSSHESGFQGPDSPARP